MHKAVIDRFVIPVEAKELVFEEGRSTRELIMRLPGLKSFSSFIRESDGKVYYITVAVWEDDEAIANAGKAIGNAAKARGFDSQRFFQEHGITLERGVYEVER